MKTSNFRKPLAVAALVAAFALTGCADKSVPDAPTPSPTTATKSATPSPTAAPTLTDAPTQSAFEIDPEANPTAVETVKDDEINRLMREGLNTALDVNVDAAFDRKVDPQVEVSFGEAKAKEGAEFALEFLHDVTTIGNFYVERDGTKDFEILETEDVTSRMDATLIEDIKSSIAEGGEDGYFRHIPSVPSDGIVNTGGDEELSMTGVPVTTYLVPDLEAVDMGEAGTGLMVDGMRTDHNSLTEGYTAKQEVNYWVVVGQSGDSWKVLDFNYTRGNGDLVKAGEAK